MERTAVVTGGAGFIGSHLCQALLAEGWRVRAVDDLSTGCRENLAECEGHSSFELILADIRRPETWRNAIDSGSVVFHQAAITSVRRSVDDPLECHSVNATGTLTVLECARQRDARRAVLASSTAVYGDLGRRAAREDIPPSPISPYAVSKLAAEQYGTLYSKLFGLPVTSLRYFNVFGPRQDLQSEYAAVIPNFIQRMLAGLPPVIYGDGEQSRDFVYVGDVVRANLAAVIAPAAGTAFNIASGESRTLLEVVGTLNRILGTSFESVHEAAQPGDVRQSKASIERAGQELGFRPQTSFGEGLQATIESIRRSLKS